MAACGLLVNSANRMVIVSSSSYPITAVSFGSAAIIDKIVGPGLVPKSPDKIGDIAVEGNEFSDIFLRLPDA